MATLVVIETVMNVTYSFPKHNKGNFKNKLLNIEKENYFFQLIF